MQARREFLDHSARLAALLATLGVLPAARAQAPAWPASAFDAKSVGDVMKALGTGAPTESKDVSLTGPDIAENGAVVPVALATTLPGVKKLLLLVEKNPNTLSASFDVSDSVEANFSTRIKMSESSNVYAVAMTGDGKTWFARKDIKVTLGGCGG